MHRLPEFRFMLAIKTWSQGWTAAQSSRVLMAGVCLCCWAMVTPGIGEALAQPKLIIVDTANDRSGNAAAPANVARQVMLNGVTYDDAMRELDPMQGKMQKVSANFLLTYVMNVDPFDSWDDVIDSWVALARAARDTGLTGFVFDNEPYNGDVWIYPGDVEHASAHSLGQYQE